MTCECLDPVVFGCHCPDRYPWPSFAAGETFTVGGWVPYTTVYHPVTVTTISNATLYIGGQPIGTTTRPITIHFTPEVPAPPGA